MTLLDGWASGLVFVAASENIEKGGIVACSFAKSPQANSACGAPRTRKNPEPRRTQNLGGIMLRSHLKIEGRMIGIDARYLSKLTSMKTRTAMTPGFTV
jgi:hypothetical protein